MNTNNPRYWFRAKRYGLGWGLPLAWLDPRATHQTQGPPPYERAVDQAAPEKAVEMHSIVHSTRLCGEAKTRGTCTSRTKEVIMAASMTAASRGSTETMSATPAAMCPIPVA
jgi:hypothetical protein